MNKEYTNPTGFLVTYFDVDPRYANRVPSGWTTIVFEALRQMRVTYPGIIFLQIKEKYGGLRIYFAWPENISEELIEKVEQIVSDAEEECSKHCENCGNTRKVETRNINDGWIATLCALCREQKINQRDRENFCFKYYKLFNQWKEEQKT